MDSGVKLRATGPPVWAVTNMIFTSNCYVCETGARGECFIVDPGLDHRPIEALLSRQRLTPNAVVCTHGHFDHAGSAAHFQEVYGCAVYLHNQDIKTLRSSNFLLMAFKIAARIKMPSVSPVSDAQPVITIGDCRVRFHPAPGHTPGSCLIEHGNTLFTGDTLYSQGVGLSSLPGEDPALLRKSILAVWDRFADETLVCPGHGDASEFGEIKSTNEALVRFLGIQPKHQFAS